MQSFRRAATALAIMAEIVAVRHGAAVARTP